MYPGAAPRYRRPHAGLGGLSVGSSPVAAASGGTVSATGGDGTAVDADGTQGDVTDAVQGAADDDGDQDAYLTNSAAATPQFKAG